MSKIHVFCSDVNRARALVSAGQSNVILLYPNLIFLQNTDDIHPNALALVFVYRKYNALSYQNMMNKLGQVYMEKNQYNVAIKTIIIALLPSNDEFSSDNDSYNENEGKIYADNNGFDYHEIPFSGTVMENKFSSIIMNFYKEYREPFTVNIRDNNEMMSKIGNTVYDVLSIIISFADFITDVIILIEYIKTGQKIFFGIGVFILICAQMSYAFAFTDRYGGSHLCEKLVLFIKVLPFTPILGVVFYFAHDKDTWFSKNILRDVFGLTPQSRSTGLNESPLFRWVNDKLYKHIGFILESLLEAFPNAVLVCGLFLYVVFVFLI